MDVVEDDAYTGTKGKMKLSDFERVERDVETREYWERRICDRTHQHICDNLKNYRIYGAVDLAWDSPPINKATYPLLLYAQNKIGKDKCVKTLEDLNCAEDYVKRNESGNVVDVDLPGFFEHNINLVRSYVTRRLAAQSNKYQSLYPYYKYHARSTSDAAKLRADAMSQVAEQIVDNYGYRDHETQVMRDMLLYAYSVDFVRSAWETEEQLKFENTPFGVDLPEDERNAKTVIEREGVVFHNPHPTRVFWDFGSPPSAINTDTRCSYMGYWDLVRYGEISDNPSFYNRESVLYSSRWLMECDRYPEYWNQYYCTVSFPRNLNDADLAAEENDRMNHIGRYSSEGKDESSLISVYFEKIVPADWGIGTYPHPVWVRLVSAGTEGTVVYAEFLPSRPAAWCGLNFKDDRKVNLSFAMSLLPYQDQLTNLWTQLLAVCKQQQFLAVGVNTDFFADDEAQKEVDDQIKSKRWYQEPFVVKHSFSKIRNLGLNDKDPIRTYQLQRESSAIEVIFNSIISLIQMIERLEAMSPNESGQPIVRGNGGVTATEASQIDQTTAGVYNFISDSIDNYRASKKQILRDSYLAHAQNKFSVPVVNRYPEETIIKAGFVPDPEMAVATEGRRMWTVGGNKAALDFNYVYSSRDGSERVQKTQISQTLAGIMPVLSNAPITKGQFVQILNSIIRNSGAGEDVILDIPDEEADQLVGEPGGKQQQQMMETLEQMTNGIQNNAQAIASIQEALRPQAPGQNPPIEYPGMAG